MEDKDKPNQGNTDTSQNNVIHSQPKSDDDYQKPKSNKDNSENSLRHKIITKLIKEPIKWIDTHNGLWTALATVVISVFTGILACNDLRKRHIEERPKFIVTNIHIWNKGKGRIFNSSNEYPTFNVGDGIEGAAIAENVGGEATEITGYCLPYWSKGPLPMFHPGWNFPMDKQTWFAFEPKKTTSPIRPAPNEHIVESGEPAKCEISTVVDQSERGADFYILGHIAYLDKLGLKHDVKFARKYVPSERRFVASDDTSYETEDK